MITAFVFLALLLAVTTGTALYWRCRCERLEEQLRGHGIEPADE